MNWLDKMTFKPTNRHGAMAIVMGAGMWGMFWIPLRYLDKNGIHGLWAISLVLLFSLLPAVGAIIFRRDFRPQDIAQVLKIGISIGAATVLYFVGVLYSDVIRVVFLFYLLPIWATLAAKLLHGEPIGRRRLLVIAIAMIGIWQLLGGNGELPMPRNVGDWCGIGSGMLWGLSLALIRDNSRIDPFTNTAAPLLIGLIFALTTAIFISSFVPSEQMLSPTLSDIMAILPMAVLFGAMILWPAMLGQVWGARLVPAPTAAILTMIEILVATISAYFIVGTELTIASMGGGLLIILAAFLDFSGGLRTK